MISIIVPVYNAEKYINKCVKSIIEPTVSDIEILLVDDGSKDDSGRILDEICFHDKRIKVFHKSNGGVSSARNMGLDNASGEYIMFVDADDWLENVLCEELIDGMIESDLAIGGYQRLFYEGTEVISGKSRTISMDTAFGNEFNVLYRSNLLNSPFSKIYKKSIIMEQRFDSSVELGEDFLFNLEYLNKCRQIAVVQTDAYIYNCLNEASATRRFRKNDIDQIVELYKAGKAFYNEYGGADDRQGALEERLCINGINLLQLLFYSNHKKSYKKKLANRLLNYSKFVDACKTKWGFPCKYDIPRKLCAKKKYKELERYYAVKKIIQNLRSKWVKYLIVR